MWAQKTESQGFESKQEHTGKHKASFDFVRPAIPDEHWAVVAVWLLEV